MLILEFKKDSYKEILRSVLRVCLSGETVYIEPDTKGKHSGGYTLELRDVVIVVHKPKKPTPEEFNQLVPEVGKRFMRLDKNFIFSKYTIENAVKKLKTKLHTRSAVFFSKVNTDDYIHCVVAGQFLIRDGLSLRVWMRSNDAFNGFIGNVMEFTYIQHEIAEELGLSVDKYIHYATSLHIYQVDLEKAMKVIS